MSTETVPNTGSALNVPDDIMQAWRQKNGREALDLYFEHILPLAISRLQERETPALVSAKPWDCLVSLMGFSPETTVLTTAVIKPKKRLVIITSEETLPHYDLVLGAVTRLGLLKPYQIDKVVVRPDDPRDIYDAVAGEIRKAEGGTLVDVTGGKKIMSATAGQAAWELNAPLCYVDGDYDPALRRPRPGTERLIVLLDPSKERARQARNTAIEAWRMRQYAHAIKLFRTSMDMNPEHNIEELAIPLCELYAALGDFRLDDVATAIGELQSVANRVYLKPIVARLGIDRCIAALDGDPRLERPPTRIAAFLALSRAYAEQHRYDFGSLLAYRAIEAAVEEGLRRLSANAFQTSAPDYTALGVDVEDLKRRYIELSRQIDGKADTEERLPAKIGLVNGFCIIALVDPEVVRTVFPKFPDIAATVRAVRSTAESRNRSILAHGTANLQASDHERIADLAMRMAHAVLPDANISRLVEDLCSPSLEGETA